MVPVKNPIAEIPHEIWGAAFSHLTWLENINTTTQVCKSWKKIAAPIVKSDLLFEKKQKLHEKMLPFLKMAKNMGMFPELETWHSLDEYCPVFKVSKDLCNDDSCMIETFFDQLKEGTQTEKQEVLLNRAFTFAGNHSMEINELKKIGNSSNLIKLAISYYNNGIKDYVKKRGFVTLRCSDGMNASFRHNDDYTTVFPIEMFNLGIKKDRLIGKKNAGNYCFPLKGALMEIELLTPTSAHIGSTYKTMMHPLSFAIYLPPMHALPIDYEFYPQKK